MISFLMIVAFLGLRLFEIVSSSGLALLILAVLVAYYL